MKSMKLKPKKKAAGSAKRKNATPAKKKIRPAKAAKKNEKSADPREIFLRDGIVTEELLLEWEKTKDRDPVANNAMAWDKKEDAVWPPPTHYKHTDLIYRVPRLSSEQQGELDKFINNIGSRPDSPNKHKNETSVKLLKLPDDVMFPGDLEKKIRYEHSQHLLIFKGAVSEEEKKTLLNLSKDDLYNNAIKSLFQRSQTADALSGELAEQLQWYEDAKRKGDSWANRSETKKAIERWRNGAEELSEGLKDMLNLMKAYGMREPSCEYPKAILVIERLGFVGVSPFLDDLLTKINKLTLAFQFAEKKLENKRGRIKEIFRITFATKLAVIFENNFTRPPTTGENGDFHQFLEMVFRWMGIKKSYIHSDVLKALGFIKKQKLAEIE